MNQNTMSWPLGGNIAENSCRLIFDHKNLHNLKQITQFIHLTSIIKSKSWKCSSNMNTYNFYPLYSIIGKEIAQYVPSSYNSATYARRFTPWENKACIEHKYTINVIPFTLSIIKDRSWHSMCLAPTTLPITLAAFALGSSSIQVYQTRNPEYIWLQT